MSADIEAYPPNESKIINQYSVEIGEEFQEQISKVRIISDERYFLDNSS